MHTASITLHVKKGTQQKRKTPATRRATRSSSPSTMASVLVALRSRLAEAFSRFLRLDLCLRPRLKRDFFLLRESASGRGPPTTDTVSRGVTAPFFLASCESRRHGRSSEAPSDYAESKSPASCAPGSLAVLLLLRSRKVTSSSQSGDLSPPASVGRSSNSSSSC
ncbi:unnamed protein product [Ixodes pacificus]